ncbi:hypothetical protein [Bacillus sp. P14.5]|uniref:hypothetical protein n=1 Tax=Bacillus sp. P14.5 TaxID=1983400 RepID=UPI0013B05FE5|nr:hypothetical protein [Bacillus sp. P14.5]
MNKMINPLINVIPPNVKPAKLAPIPAPVAEAIDIIVITNTRGAHRNITNRAVIIIRFLLYFDTTATTTLSKIIKTNIKKSDIPSPLYFQQFKINESLIIF